MRKVNSEIPEIKLGWKQKLILEVLQDEFGGSAFGPELLDSAENEDIHKLTINEVTWAFKVLYENGLVNKEKKVYQNRFLNLYSVSEYVIYNSVVIK